MPNISCQTFACFLGAVSRHFIDFCDPGNQQQSYICHVMPGFFISRLLHLAK